MPNRIIFDKSILQEPASALPNRRALVHSQDTAVATAIASMQQKHLGSVLVTRTGKSNSPVTGIFTERDVLIRVLDQVGTLSLMPLSDVMTKDPVVGMENSTLAWLLHWMKVEGMRHIPIVNAKRHPLYVISVRDIVTLLVDSFPPSAIE